MAFSLTPVVAEDFIGRREITNEMTEQLSSSNKIGFSISGIRRVGKTSILKEVGRRLSVKKLPVVYVSVWRVSPNTIDEFVSVMNRASIKAFQDRLPRKFRFEELLATGKTALFTFLQNLKLSAKVSEDLEFTVSYIRKETSDVDSALSGCFSLIEHLAEMTKSRSVLVIDEFPSMMDLTYGTKNQKIGESIIRLVRTLYEDFRMTKLVVSGSYQETMKNLTIRKHSPFYKQLLLRNIESFSDLECDQFIQHYLPELKFANEDARRQLYYVTSGIPYNLQLIGTEIQLQDIVRLDSEKVSDVVRTVLKKEGELSFKEFTDNLSPSEVKVLKSLAKDPKTKPNQIAAHEFIDKDTIGPAISGLVKKGLIERSGRGIYVFTDNLFAEWLKIMDDIYV